MQPRGQRRHLFHNQFVVVPQTVKCDACWRKSEKIERGVLGLVEYDIDDRQ
jgi:hypothetical protein